MILNLNTIIDYSKNKTKPEFIDDLKNAELESGLSEEDFKIGVNNKIIEGLNKIYLYFNKRKAEGFTLNDTVVYIVHRLIIGKHLDIPTILKLNGEVSPMLIPVIQNILFGNTYRKNPVLYYLGDGELIVNVVVRNLSPINQETIFIKSGNVQVVITEPNCFSGTLFNSDTDKILNNYYPSVIASTDFNSWGGNYGPFLCPLQPDVYFDENLKLERTRRVLFITIPINALNSVGDPGIPYFVDLETIL